MFVWQFFPDALILCMTLISARALALENGHAVGHARKRAVVDQHRVFQMFVLVLCMVIGYASQLQWELVVL